MYNKEGLPVFIIIIPFLLIVFISFFSLSYHLKISHDSELFLKQYKQNQYINSKIIDKLQKDFEKANQIKNKEYTHFMLILTGCVMVFMTLFTILMKYIISTLINKYIQQVQDKEQKLQNLNKTLQSKVKLGIQEAKQKDKAIIAQSKLAHMGSLISMIAHQWRQPLSELSGVLMELETATRFKKLTSKRALVLSKRGDEVIEYMSSTIDDFRNFYKPDKKKEYFRVSFSCKKAISIINAALKNLNIKLDFIINHDSIIYGYPTEYSQVVLNILSNAKDVLKEKNIKNPTISLFIEKQENENIVTIHDNAGGIKEEYMDLIFDPYFSTKSQTKGTGLGLYISKLIIEENMGGKLLVKNGKQGAIFKIILKENK